MTHIPVTLLYGSLTALLVAALGANVSRLRGTKKVFIGDTPDSELQRTIRAHGNATEWAPLMIVMLLILELIGTSSLILHVCGGAILTARLSHAVGVLTKNPLSTVGASLTYLVALGMPIYALVLRFR